VLGCWVWGCGRCHALPLRMDQRDEMVAPEDDDTADARLMAEVCVAAQSATPFRVTRWVEFLSRCTLEDAVALPHSARAL
jgi:hypothetical protein